MVVYDEDGNMTGDPKPTDRCSCFIDKEYEMGNRVAGSHILLSHVEIVTFSGMQNSWTNTSDQKRICHVFFQRKELQQRLKLK